MTKYQTDTERKEAQRLRSKEHYERNKNNPEFIEKRKEIARRYCENNRNMINEKAREYYYKNNDYRIEKIDKFKQKYNSDEIFREAANISNKQRYWLNKSKMLEMEIMLLAQSSTTY